MLTLPQSFPTSTVGGLFTHSRMTLDLSPRFEPAPQIFGQKLLRFRKEMEPVFWPGKAVAFV